MCAKAYTPVRQPSERIERPEQHQIEESAKRFFTSALPTEWVSRAQSPDYHVDYADEVGASGSLMGIQFGVQLKGKKKTSLARGRIAFPLETKDLVYYVDKRCDPIFLVVVDVTAGQGYWLFLQKYALEELAGKTWRAQKHVTLHLPVSNSLADITQLETAVRSANQHMAGLRPGAVAHAIIAERRRLESLDPRFRIAVTAGEQSCRYDLLPSESVRFTLSFEGEKEKVSRLVEDFANRGLPVMVNPGEVKLEGSPLLAKLLEQSLTIQSVRRFQGHLRLAPVNSEGREIATLELPACGEGGLAEMRLKAAHANSPLQLELTIAAPGGVPSKVVSFSFGFALSQWAGRRVLHLPYFDQVHALCRAVQDGSDLRIDFLWEGNPLFGGRAKSCQLKPLEEPAMIVRTYAKARELARHLRVNPIVPADMRFDELDEIEELHLRVMPGDRRLSGAKATLRVSILRESLDAGACNSQYDNMDDVPLKLRFDNEPVRFLRESVNAGPGEYELTHAQRSTPLADIKSLISVGKDQTIPLTYRGTAASELIVRRPSDAQTGSGAG